MVSNQSSVLVLVLVLVSGWVGVLVVLELLTTHACSIRTCSITTRNARIIT